MRTELHGMLQKLRDSQDFKWIYIYIFIYISIENIINMYIYICISIYECTLTRRHAQNYTLKVKYPAIKCSHVRNLGLTPTGIGLHQNDQRLHHCRAQ